MSTPAPSSPRLWSPRGVLPPGESLVDQPRLVDPAPEPSPFGDVDSDAELLKAFAAASPGSSSAQAVLTQIVARHGTMVYRVAQRMVGDPTLVDDVFQATFLVLAQSARKIQKTASLASWLHGTARNIGRRALHDKYGVRSQTTAGVEMVTAVEDDPFTEMIRSHERQLLDEELQQLPEIYRAPLVLHYFEQRSNQDISLWLGITVAAVESRLKRAKQLLRARLVRRGMTLSVAVAALGASSSIATATPSVALVTSTVTLAATTPTITASLTTVAASAALQLAGKELTTMSAASKITALLLSAAGTLTLGGAVLFGSAYGGLNGKGQGTVTASAEPNGVIETDTELGVLEQEPQQLVLAAVDPPAKANEDVGSTSSTELVNSGSPPPPTLNELHDEDADLSSEEEAKLEKELQEKLLEKLKRPVTFNYPDVTLEEAARLVADQCEVTVVLGISKIPGINSKSRVRLVANGETLASALRTMLANVDGQNLDFSTDHGVICFDSADVIEKEYLRKQRIGHFNRRALAPFVSGDVNPRAANEHSQPQDGAKKQEGTASTDANTTQLTLNGEDAQPASQPGATITAEGNKVRVKTKDTQISASEVRINGASSNQGGSHYSEHNAPIVAAIRNLNAADRKVYEALDQETTLAFQDTPLKEVFAYLQDKHQLKIWTDLDARQDEGVDLENQINAEFSDLPLDVALSFMLQKVGDISLDYYVDRGMLVITTAEKTRKNHCLRFYDLSGELENLPIVMQAYAERFQVDEPWNFALTSFGDCLAIETSFANHQKIEEMIVGVMRVAVARKAAGKEFIIPDPNYSHPAPVKTAPAAGAPQQPAGAVGDSGAAGGTPAGNGGSGGGFN
ncbi:MAG: sigma-70 family RNA polymerase sigma factor [Planctomycetaceae bacterium]